MRYLSMIILLWVPHLLLSQQTLNLQDCYALAIANHPIGQKQAVLQSLTDKNQDKLKADRLPRFDLYALAGIQSEQVEFPSDAMVPFAIDLPLEKAQAGVQLSYALYDGGVRKAKVEIDRTALQAELYQVEVALSKLKSEVNEAFFGLKLQHARREILQSSLDQLKRRREVMLSARSQGTVLPSQIKQLEVRMLELESEIQQADLAALSAAAGLSALLGQEVDTSAELQPSALDGFAFSTGHQLPEQRLQQLERERILARESMISASRRPVVMLNGRAGLGYPNPLNFFDTNLAPFGLVEVSLRWTMFDWGKAKREREILNLRAQLIDVQSEVLDYQVALAEDQMRNRILSLQQQLKKDESIQALQREILNEISARVDQGVATANAYLDQLDDLTRARLSQQLHLIQLDQARVDYLTQKGLL